MDVYPSWERMPLLVPPKPSSTIFVRRRYAVVMFRKLVALLLMLSTAMLKDVQIFVAIVEGVEITSETWTELTNGKQVFLEFVRPFMDTQSN
jgi:hypothetical protein